MVPKSCDPAQLLVTLESQARSEKGPMSSEKLTILIPCLNEERNLTATVENAIMTARDLPMDFEIIMIDDGSRDATQDVMKRLCGEHSCCRMRVNPRNLGVGRSVMSAYDDVSDRSWVTVLPGDNEFDFRSIHNFIALRDQYDLVLGYFQNPVIRPFRRRFASASFGSLVKTLYGFDFRYLNGMKLYKVEVFREIEVESANYAYTAELIAKAILRNPALRVGEAPFVATGRAYGSSNAFRPRAVATAAYEVLRGQRSVAAYREQVIRREESED